jgi:Protein of unknown function (DUF2924)
VVKTDGPARDTEVSRLLEALPALSPDQLRKEWRRLYRSQPPRLSRDLLARAIAYRIQELRYGGLSKATRRKLAALVQARRSDGEIAPENAQRIRAGAHLVREWNGRRCACSRSTSMDRASSASAARRPMASPMGASRLLGGRSITCCRTASIAARSCIKSKPIQASTPRSSMTISGRKCRRP